MGTLKLIKAGLGLFTQFAPALKNFFFPEKKLNPKRAIVGLIAFCLICFMITVIGADNTAIAIDMLDDILEVFSEVSG